MRRTLMGIAFGLVVLPFAAHASVESDLKAGQPIQAVLTNALKDNVSIDAALKQVIAASPSDAYAAITAAIQLAPDQASNIVSAALSRQFNLNPPQVVGAALQGAPEKAGVIVPTAIVRSPSYYTVPIVQRALSEGVEGDKFVAQAMRIAPRQADTILTQALRSAPQQTKSIMEAAIADQPDQAVSYVKTALAAKANPSDVLAAAMKVVPRQADAIAAAAREAGVPPQLIAAAGMPTGEGGFSSGFMPSTARPANITVTPIFSPAAGGGGGGSGTRNASKS